MGSQIDFPFRGPSNDLVPLFGRFTFHAHRVEERRVIHRKTVGPDCPGKMFGHDMHALRNFLQTLRPVIHRVERSHVRQQRLRGADVAGGLFAADVLLARAQGEAQGRFAARILGHADDAPGHVALEFIARRKKGRVRPAVPERHAETLRAADGDVRAEFARRFDQRQRQQIRGDREHRAGCMGFFCEGGIIMDRTERVGILHQRAKNVFVERKSLVIAHHNFDSQGVRAAGTTSMVCG